MTYPDFTERARAAMRWRPTALAGLMCAAHAGAIWAQSTELPAVTVSGSQHTTRSEVAPTVEALPAPTYVLDAEQIQALPVREAMDMLRSTPGVTFGASSPGSDIGDDISIRGFSSYHGADVAVYIDGVPVNWPNGGMRHGMVDFNWLSPDIVERIEVIKGPFSAEYGNFNLAGAINIITKTTGETSVGVEAGSFDSYRASATYGRKMGNVTPFLAYEVLDRKGYRAHSDYRRLNAFNKFTFDVPQGRLSLRFNASVRDSQSAGFLLADDVRSGRVSRRSASPDALNDKGSNDYYTLVANYVPNADGGITATAYAGREELLLVDTAFGPPTGAIRGEREYAGWRVSKLLRWGTQGLLTVGTDGQFDRSVVAAGDPDGGDGVAQAGRSRDQTVHTGTAGIYAQGQWKLIDQVKLVGGARYDRIRTEVDNRLTPNSGTATQGVVSPKVGVVYSPVAMVDLFANTGMGFRSPAATELAPDRTGAAFNSGLKVAKLRSSDLGATVRPLPGLSLTGSLFTTRTESELRRDPTNPLNVVNVGETQRDGYELVVQWAVTPRLSFSASHTDVRTRIRNPAVAGEDKVITVPDDTQTLGISWNTPLQSGMKFNADLLAQRVGKRPLRADGSLYAGPQWTIGTKLRLAQGPWSGFLQVDIAPNRYSSDFVYDIGGIAFDPRPPVAVSVGVKYAFQ
nr:TonB-dependent receptor [Variovorax boronicumulans]